MSQTLDVLRFSDNIVPMTGAYNLSGSSSVFRNLMRFVVIGAATVGGIFIVAASAAFALFLAVGMFALGAIAFGIFWLRAKITGRPMGPQVKFFYRPAARTNSSENTQDGPVIDAHETADGWSVDR